MPQLLPAAPTKEEFYRQRGRPPEDWISGLREIARRHELDAGTITRFPDGEFPVFALGTAHVIKLVPAFGSELVQNEIEFLSFISPYPGLPSAHFAARGIFEDWNYLITTRVAGKLLQQAWPEMAAPERIEMARDCGRLLAALHALPQKPAHFSRNDWPAFCAQAIREWPTRPSVKNLSDALQIDGPRYLNAHIAGVATPPTVALHGDLAPVNLLVDRAEVRWKISGIIDFGNAMQGNRWFDLAAMGVLLQPGERTIVHALFEGYAPGASQRMPEIRRWMQINCLIHPLADQAGCLSLIPAAAQCATWDDVALLFWPD